MVKALELEDASPASAPGAASKGKTDVEENECSVVPELGAWGDHVAATFGVNALTVIPPFDHLQCQSDGLNFNTFKKKI